MVRFQWQDETRLSLLRYTVQRQTPILNLYSSRKAGTFRPDDHRLMVWSGQSLYAWHVNRLIAPNERTTDEQKKRGGYFVFHNDQWWLVNEGLSGLISLPDRKTVGIGEKLLLEDNTQFILSSEDGGRLVVTTRGELTDIHHQQKVEGGKTLSGVLVCKSDKPCCTSGAYSRSICGVMDVFVGMKFSFTLTLT